MVEKLETTPKQELQSVYEKSLQLYLSMSEAFGRLLNSDKLEMNNSYTLYEISNLRLAMKDTYSALCSDLNNLETVS
jgi:hypothetical protein